MTAAEAAAVLQRFVVDDRLRVIPARRNAKLVVFAWLAERFEPGRRYAEADVNRILGAVHPDFATLRRGLYDEHFVDRSDGIYWRTAAEQRLVLRSAPES